jgi:glycosyltransferase involved in cell wall biosynthesis
MGRRPRLAHLTTVDMSLALLLATELRVDVEHGFEVFGISAPGPFVPEVEALGVHHVAVPSLSRAWSLAADARAARELWQVLRRLDLDVLHVHNPKTGVLGRILGRLAGVPVVLNTCHGLWVRFDSPPVKKAAVYAAEALAAAFSDAELYQNDADRMAMRRFVRHRKQRTVGNGVDLDRFRYDEEGRARVREQWGVGPDDVVVGGVGRLVAEKGIDTFVDVATALAHRAAFVWVGPSDAAKGDALAPPDGAVRFVGLRADMPAVYSAVDVFVLPSHREGFSRSAMEAAACRCALVLSDIRGCREIGDRGTHLLLATPGDAVAFTEAVARLVDDPAERARLARAAEARARDAFDQRHVAAQSLDVVREIARRKGVDLGRPVGR